MSTPLGAAGPAGDALPEAVALARGAAEARLPLKLFGGLAVRVLGPGLPPRTRRGQDMDFACLSKRRKDVAALPRAQRLRARPQVLTTSVGTARCTSPRRPGGRLTSWWTD